MAKTKNMTRNRNNRSVSTKKRLEGYSAPWSDLNHHVLYLVMMQLGVIDFVAFSGVCKSWRSLALSNRNIFMASKPPMFIRVSPRAHKNACYLIDFQGRKFKTIIPHLVGRTCLGSTCGYLILYGSKERDIWLVNPITRHELHFPEVPFSGYDLPGDIRGILVFSPSMSGWVFVLVKRFDEDIWFSISGQGSWKHVISDLPVLDLHAFNRKIYLLNGIYGIRYLYELRLDPKPNLTKLEISHYPKTYLRWDLLSFDKKLYMMESYSEDSYKVHELDFDEMKWVSHEKTTEEYAFFLSELRHCGAFKQESSADPCSQYARYVDFEKSEEGRFFVATNMWYFPHDCLNVDCLDE